MPRNNVRIEGLDNALRELNTRISRLRPNNNRAIKDVAFDLLSKAQERAPFDTGDLKGSGFVDMQDNAAVVGFSEKYALRQHEALEYRHPRGGEAKYLENPLKENTDRYVQHIANSVRRSVD